MITVRSSETGDSDGIRRVSESATATLRKTYRPNQKALAGRDGFSMLLKRIVALIDGGIVGTVQYYPDGGDLRLIGLLVHADYRRRGVARALLCKVADIARIEGRSMILARTVKETGNVPMFLKLGFEVVEERPDEYSESDTHAELTEVDLRLFV